MSRCFLLAALLRGLYHDHLVYGRRQVLHHPLRTAFLPDLSAEPLPFGGNRTAELLANIIHLDALTERDLGNRLSRWVNTIVKIREANVPGNERIDLRPKEGPKQAEKEAVRAAQELGIHPIPRRLESFLSKVFGAGSGKMIGSVLTVILTPYAGFTGAIIGEAAGELAEMCSEPVAGIAVEKICANRRYLLMLAKAPPGRLSSWRLWLPF